MRVALFLIALAVAGLPPTAAPLAQPAGVYAVSPLDRLEVRVAQWNAPERTMEPIEFLTGVYAVDADGSVVLPVVGEVQVAGLSAAQVAASVERDLKDRLGLVDDLFVSMRVDTHAPIFVVGAVEDPGSFEFRPGLRALQAVALAGGVQRSRNLFTRTDRDAVNALGDYRLLEVDRQRALAHVARLEAELADETEIAAPAELSQSPMGDDLLDVEKEVLAARQDDHRDALAALDDLKALVTARINKIDAEVKVRKRLLRTARRQVDAVRQLSSRGLANNARITAAERFYGESEARLLELETARLAAQQQLAEAERDEASLIGERRVIIVTELQEARNRLARARVRIDAASALYAEAARFGSVITELASGQQDRQATFVITRPAQGAGEVERTFLAAANTPMRPGDVLEVRAPELGDEATGTLVTLGGADLLDAPAPVDTN